MKGGRYWHAAWRDGHCVASLTRGDRMGQRTGYWLLDRQTYDRLDDDNALALIREAECIFFYVNSNHFGTAGTVYRADADQLCAGDPAAQAALRAARCAQFRDDYPENGHWDQFGKRTPLDQSEPWPGAKDHF